MKKNCLLLCLFAVLSCTDKPSKKISDDELKFTKVDKFPTIKFNETFHDFGTIKEGEIASFDFEITNTGEVDLLILDAKGSCGCTVPVPPKAPIKPGKTSVMNVKFDSNGKPGFQEKSITIITNTKEGFENLMIKAEVLPKKMY